MAVNLLLDTNIIIPLEPASVSDLEPDTFVAIQLFQIAQEVGVGMFIHPQQLLDFEKDADDLRRGLRAQLVGKYRQLQSPPPLTDRVMEAATHPAVSSNSWIDAHLIAALDGSAVDYLVSNDRGLRKVCGKLGIEDRCLTLAAALDLLNAERTIVPKAPPAVTAVKAYELDAGDPMFAELRSDYPPFDGWFDKCKREHRQCWRVQMPGFPTYAGVAIVNPENKDWADAKNPTLKLCTFKIAADVRGAKLGELLLRAVFDYAHGNDFQTIFVEAFPKQGALIHLLHDFGFEAVAEKPSTELVLRKRMSPFSSEDLRTPPPEFARKFGPFVVRWDGVQSFIVPIEPRFFTLLFPDQEPQGSLLAGTESFGNTLIKAYLCRAQIRRIRRGDLVFFYRSGDWQSLVTAGVVESVKVTDDAEEMAKFLRKRTVYSFPDIEEQCRRGGTIGFTFRHAPIISRQIPLDELISQEILNAAPQSITELSSNALSWIQAHR